MANGYMLRSTSSLPESEAMFSERSRNILIRCDGSHTIGFGHVVRCVALADELCAQHDCRVTFLMRHGPEGIEYVRAQGHAVLTPKNARQRRERTWPQSLAESLGADLMVWDCRDDFPRSAIGGLRERGMLVAVIDDISDRCLSSDLVFFPPVPQLNRINWSEFSGQRFVGWEWVLLRGDLQEMKKNPPSHHTCPRVLVTMGGSDPHGFTLKALRACSLVTQNIEVIVVLGPGFSGHQKLERIVDPAIGNVQIFSNIKNLPQLIHESDLVVGAFGNTAYEAAALERFGIYLCATADHAESASEYMQAGFGVSLGLGAEITDAQLAAAIDTYVSTSFRSHLHPSDAIEHSLDGLGVVRIAEKLIQTIKERHGIQQAVAAT